MKKQVIIAAVAAVAIVAGIAVSCAKDTSDANFQNQVSPIAAKSTADDLNYCLNLVYQLCVSSYLNDSIEYWSKSVDHDTSKFYPYVGISSALRDSIMDEVNEIHAHSCVTPSLIQIPAPGGETKPCDSCDNYTVADFAAKIVDIYRVADRLEKLDTTFNGKEPFVVTATLVDGFYHLCEHLKAANGDPTWAYYHCLMIRFADYQLSYLLYRETELQRINNL